MNALLLEVGPLPLQLGAGGGEAGGRRFTSGYSTASTCTPTRYSFLTGSYAFRRKGTGIAPPNGHLVVPPDAVTVAEVAAVRASLVTPTPAGHP